MKQRVMAVSYPSHSSSNGPTDTMTDRGPDTVEPSAGGLFQGYPLGAAYDEMFDRDQRPRPHYQALFRRLQGLSAAEFRRRKAMTDLSMLQDGVGFTVYRQQEGIERIWPMDPVPRIIPAAEWKR